MHQHLAAPVWSAFNLLHTGHCHVVCDPTREAEVVAENVWKLFERRDAVSRRSPGFRFKTSTIGCPTRDTYFLASHRFQAFSLLPPYIPSITALSRPTNHVVCLCHINPRVQIMSQVQCFALQLHRALCGNFLESGCRCV